MPNCGERPNAKIRKTANAANIEFRNVRVRVAPINIPSKLNAQEETRGMAIDHQTYASAVRRTVSMSVIRRTMLMPNRR